MSEVSTLKNEIETYRSNPAMIQRRILKLLEDTNAGNFQIVDPSNPFVFLLEAATVTSSAAMAQNEATARQVYPTMALTEDELYRHMSDKDYIGRFSTPSRTTFTVLIGKEELYQRAVDTGVNGIRKLVIPRHTEFHVADHTFTMQYPIDVRIMAHGGVQVVYDVTKPSPLQTIGSNVVDWEMVNIDGTDFVKMDIPVQQFAIKTHYVQLNKATGFSKSYALNNNFYHCRVYAAKSDGSWEEILTTHTEQVFDPLTPTAVLKVYNNELNVTIPHVYMSTNLVQREIRIDIYTTEGPLDLLLSNYQVGAFSARWVDLENDDLGVYSAPLEVFATLGIYSDQAVAGGSNRLDFEELRERVITNGLGQPDLPITNVQLGAALSDMGYQVVRDVDNVTNRIYLATRRLPAPSNGTTIGGANARVMTLKATMAGLADYGTVADNGNRVTILPNTLYKSENGLVELVSPSEKAELDGLGLDLLADQVSNTRYLFCPFHYVLDANDGIFSARPYFLDRPEVEGRQFIQENPSGGVSVSTANITITRVETGYRLRVVTRSGKTFKEREDDSIHVQLGFRPVGEERNAYVNGRLVGKVEGERVYEFDLSTDYDIDREDGLHLTSFAMFNGEVRRFPANLLTTFDIVYYLEGNKPADYETTAIDTLYNGGLLSDAVYGVTHEQVDLRLGWNLEGLWSNTRTVVSSQEYRRHTTDVPMTYSKNVYEIDPATGVMKLELDESGEVIYNLLHRAGDIVLDEEGNTVYKHRAGDVILGEDGQPEVVSNRGLLRHVDIPMIDGKYFFATETRTVDYRRSMVEQMVNWVIEDIRTISQRLLEQTKLFFYPQTTFGQMKVMVEEGSEVTIDSEQSFQVTFYMTKAGYRNGALRSALTEMAIETIAEALAKPAIATNEIISTLTGKAGDDVLGIDLKGLGGSDNYAALTVLDESMRCSIAKKLTALADNTLAVEDDVQVNFIRHETD